MSKGFVVFAKNTDKVDYVKQAYALALSIKSTQHTVSDISIVTNDAVPSEYKSVFDKIIPIPWYVEDSSNFLAAEHRWKLYHASPYDETIVLDTDMLFFEDVSLWWKHLENYDLKFCSKVKNYKEEIIEKDTAHRKAFIANNLPNVYYALHYFKKCDAAYEFYKVLEFVVNNWELCYGKFAPKEYQKWLSMDLASAIAVEMLGIQETALDTHGPLVFTHMKPAIQNWLMDNAKWQNAVHSYMNSSGEFTVANIKQFGLFHYVEKDFLTADIVSILEENADARR